MQVQKVKKIMKVKKPMAFSTFFFKKKFSNFTFIKYCNFFLMHCVGV